MKTFLLKLLIVFLYGALATFLGSSTGSSTALAKQLVQPSKRVLAKKNLKRSIASLNQRVEISGYFTLQNTPVRFLLQEKQARYYLTLFVKGSVCDYYVQRLTAPQQIRGRRGVVISNKIRECYKDLDPKTKKLFNSLVLVDVFYSLRADGQIEGEIKLSSLIQDYKVLIEQK